MDLGSIFSSERMLMKVFDGGSRQDSTGDVDHLQVLCSCETGNASRLGSNIVVDGSLYPRNLCKAMCERAMWSEIEVAIELGDACYLRPSVFLR